MSHSKAVCPSITIVTPSFNQGRFVERTIQSVLGQNYPSLEYIVVDGGSTDETLSILKRYEGQLRWISEKDRGQSDAINKGFRIATGDIIAWLNSDDVYLPGALQKVGTYFAAHPDVMMVYGEGYMIDEHGTVKSRFPFTEPKFDLWKLIYYGDYILQQTTFYRRSVFDSIPMLNVALHYAMDWDLFIRIGKRFRVDYIPEFLGSIREHGEAKTTIGGSKRFREIRNLIRTHGLQLFSMAYFNYAWDSYGKLFGNGSSGGSSHPADHALRLLARRILEKSFAMYQRRIPQAPYPDGWTRKKTILVLPDWSPDMQKSQVIVAGEAAESNTPFRISVKVNRLAAGFYRIDRPGRFEIAITLPVRAKDLGCFHVELQSTRTFVPARLGISEDGRELGFLLRDIRLEP